MDYYVGDIIYVPTHRNNGIIIDVHIINETRIIDDLWCTQILVQETLYKVLILGKIVTLTKSLIEKPGK